RQCKLWRESKTIKRCNKCQQSSIERPSHYCPSPYPSRETNRPALSSLSSPIGMSALGQKRTCPPSNLTLLISKRRDGTHWKRNKLRLPRCPNFGEDVFEMIAGCIKVT